TPALRPRPRRLASQARLSRLRGREADPGFLAALREELAAGPPAPARNPYSSRTLTPGQRAILRTILVGAAGGARHQGALEFRRRTGRTLALDRITANCRRLGVPIPWSNYHERTGEAVRRRHHFAGGRVV